MRRQLASGFGGYKHIAVFIAKMAVIADWISRSAVVGFILAEGRAERYQRWAQRGPRG